MASNIFPRQLVRFTEMMLEENWKHARQEQLRLYDLFKILFIESNPGPVKFAAELLNIMNKRMRLPLTPPLKENQEKIEKIINKYRESELKEIPEISAY